MAPLFAFLIIGNADVTFFRVNSLPHGFVLERVICTSESREVCLARSDLLNTTKIVKTYHASFPQRLDSSELGFSSESAVLLAILHPNIVRLDGIGVDQWGRRGFLVLEQLTELNAIAATQHASREIFINLLLQMASAVEVLHRRGIFHGDLKSQHFLVAASDADRPVIKLIDFGSSGELRSPHPTSRVLTPQLAAPELLRGAPTTLSSDVYSLGLVFLECLGISVANNIECSSPQPFLREANARYSAATIERDLLRLVTIMTDPEPQRRPASASSISHSLFSLARAHNLAIWNDSPHSAFLTSPALVGNEHVLQSVQQAISDISPDATHSMAIRLVGAPGSGKSRMLREIAKICFTRGMTGFISINAAEHNNHSTSLETAVFTANIPTSPFGVRHHQLPTLIIHAQLDSIESPGEDPRSVDMRPPSPLTLTLKPLTHAQVAASLRSSLGLSSIAQDISSQLFALAGGNPSRTWTVARLGFSNFQLRLDADTLSLADRGDLSPGSDAVGAICGPLFNSLTPNARHILILLATSSAGLTADDLAEASGLSIPVVHATLRDLLASGCAVQEHTTPSGLFLVGGLLLAKYCQQVLSPEEIHARHRRLHLAYLRPPVDWTRLHAAGVHARLSGDIDLARTAFCSAADISIAAERHAETIKSLVAAQELSASPLTTATTSLALSHAYSQSGQFREALQVLHKSLGVDDPSLECSLLLKICSVQSQLGEYHAAIETASKARATAFTHSLPIALLSAEYYLGASLIWVDKRRAGSRLLLRSLTKARRLERMDLVCLPLADLAATYWTSGRYALALSYSRRCVALERRYLNGRSSRSSAMNIAILLTDLGRYKAAQRAFRALMARASSTDSRSDRSALLINHGETYRAAGALRIAHRMYSVAHSHLEKSGARHRSVIALVNQARVMASAGYIAESIRMLHQSSTPRFKSPGAFYRVMVLLAWSQVLEACGAYRFSLNVARMALRISRGFRLVHTILESQVFLSSAAFSLRPSITSITRLTHVLHIVGSRSPYDVRLHAEISVESMKLRLGISPDQTISRISRLLVCARGKGLRIHIAMALFALARYHLLSRNHDSLGLLRPQIEEVASVSGNRSQYWRAHDLLGQLYECRLDYPMALKHYRVAALTLSEISRELGRQRYRELFITQNSVRDCLRRYECIQAEAGRRARHDLAVLARSEAVSRKMLASLSEIGHRLSSVLELQPLLSQILDLAISITEAERGVVFLRQADDGEFVAESARGVGGLNLEDLSRFSRSVVRQAAQGRTILTVDVGQDPVLQQAQSITVNEIKSVLCLPMRSRGRVIGVLYLDTQRRQRLFTEKDRAFVESFANQAAVAIDNARLFGSMREENSRLKQEVSGRFRELIGTSDAMTHLREQLAGITEAGSTVLLTGESGTGKEVVARAIHANGTRSGARFVPVDCGALPEQLLEAELFGYQRGAFTGADRDRVGLFEAANGGTLFLDEITNTSLALQARLLRVLQEREVRRLGENQARKVDVRIIAATNAPMEDLVAEGRFRQDLYYRLNVVRVEVPPLRERVEDIALLAKHFLDRVQSREGADGMREAAGKAGRSFGPGVLEALARRDWPGNVRELENMVERLHVLTRGPVITLGDLQRISGGAAHRAEGAGRFAASSAKTGEQRMIEDALRRCLGDRAKAARDIGWNRQKLYRRLKSYGIPAGYGRKKAA